MKMLERECQVCGAKLRYYTDSSEEEDMIKASSQPCGHQGLSTLLRGRIERLYHVDV